MSIYFASPIAKSSLWGGKTLRQYFNYPEDFGDDVGQAWLFSTQEGASNVLRGGGYDGRTLRELWQEQPQLFNSRYDEFPFIISFLVPEDDLSIQVHPDKKHAAAVGNGFGKTEAWVLLQAGPGATVVYDHVASDEAQLRSMIAAGQWDELVCRQPVHRDDVVFVPAGTLHALGKQTIAYEIAQAADITYRFYDYDRADAKGNKRPLQLEEAIACLSYDHDPERAHPAQQVIRHENMVETICLNNDYFITRRIECDGAGVLDYPGYQLATVVAGKGTVGGESVFIGDNFLIPDGEKPVIEGRLTLLLSSEAQ